jgi:site-specific DNA-cytosine methylase
VKRLWYKAKSSAWSLVFLLVMALGLIWFVYNIIRPTKDKTGFMENVQGKINSAIKENEIRATLEKDKIGAIKKIYDQKLKETKKIEDREERLKALIRLHEELDL